MATVTLEESDVRAFIRVLSNIFGVQSQGDAAAHARTQELIQSLIQKVQVMSDTNAQVATELSRLQADVASQSTVIASATTAFQGLAAQLAAAEAAAKAAGATDAQVAALVAVRQGLETNTAALAAAIPANTPAAGGGTPTPEPTPAPAPAPAPSPAPVDPNAPAGTTTAPTPGQPT